MVCIPPVEFRDLENVCRQALMLFWQLMVHQCLLLHLFFPFVTHLYIYLSCLCCTILFASMELVFACTDDLLDTLHRSEELGHI